MIEGLSKHVSRHYALKGDPEGFSQLGHAPIREFKLGSRDLQIRKGGFEILGEVMPSQSFCFLLEAVGFERS